MKNQVPKTPGVYRDDFTPSRPWHIRCPNGELFYLSFRTKRQARELFDRLESIAKTEGGK